MTLIQYAQVGRGAPPRKLLPKAWPVHVKYHPWFDPHYVICRGTGYVVSHTRNTCEGCCADNVRHAFSIGTYTHTCAGGDE